MLKYHLIKSGCSLGLMFDSIIFRDYAEMVDNVLTSDETLRPENLKETISSIDENEDAETEVVHSWININMDFQAIETVCHILIEQLSSIKCLERLEFLIFTGNVLKRKRNPNMPVKAYLKIKLKE